LIKQHRKLAGLGVEPLHRILTNTDTDWQERAEPAMHSAEQLDPIVWCLGARDAVTPTSEKQR